MPSATNKNTVQEPILGTAKVRLVIEGFIPVALVQIDQSDVDWREDWREAHNAAEILDSFVGEDGLDRPPSVVSKQIVDILGDEYATVRLTITDV